MCLLDSLALFHLLHLIILSNIYLLPQWTNYWPPLIRNRRQRSLIIRFAERRKEKRLSKRRGCFLVHAINDYLNALLSTGTHIAVQARLDELGFTEAAKQHVGFLGR